jgi:hypothetical protein
VLIVKSLTNNSTTLFIGKYSSFDLVIGGLESSNLLSFPLVVEPYPNYMTFWHSFCTEYLYFCINYLYKSTDLCAIYSLINHINMFITINYIYFVVCLCRHSLKNHTRNAKFKEEDAILS